MSEKRISSVWIAVLGVVVGALLVLTIQKAIDNKAKLRSEYTNWRK